MRLAAVLVAFAFLLAVPVVAQDAPSAAVTAVEALERGGNTVFVVPPATAAGPAVAPPPPSFQDRIAAFRLAMEPILAAIPEIPTAAAAAVTAAGDGSVAWLLPALLVAALVLGLGTAAYLYAGRLCARLVLSIGFAPPHTRAGRIGRALERLMRGGLSAFAFFAVGTLVTLLLVPEPSPQRATALFAVLGVSVVLAVRSVFNAILAPYDGTSRLVPFTDAAARSFFLQLLVGGTVSAIVTYVGLWLRSLSPDVATDKALLVLSSTVALVIFVGVILAHRKEITAAILQGVVRPGIAPGGCEAFLWPRSSSLVYFSRRGFSRWRTVAVRHGQIVAGAGLRHP